MLMLAQRVKHKLQFQLNIFFLAKHLQLAKQRKTSCDKYQTFAFVQVSTPMPWKKENKYTYSKVAGYHWLLSSFKTFLGEMQVKWEEHSGSSTQHISHQILRLGGQILRQQCPTSRKPIAFSKGQDLPTMFPAQSKPQIQRDPLQFFTVQILL